MPRNRLAVLAVAGIATLGGVSGVALGHGGGGDRHHGKKADRMATCSLSETQLLTAQTSPALARLEARLDARVAAGRMTQAAADARFARAQLRVSLAEVVRSARIAPLLALIGMTEQQVKDARAAGTSLREILEEKDVTRAQLRQALRDGRRAAGAALAAACPMPSDDGGPGTTTTAPETTTAPAA